MGVSSDLKSRYKLCLCTMLTYIVKQHALWELSHFFLSRETQLSVRLWLVYCVRCVIVVGSTCTCMGFPLKLLQQSKDVCVSKVAIAVDVSYLNQKK